MAVMPPSGIVTASASWPSDSRHSFSTPAEHPLSTWLPLVLMQPTGAVARNTGWVRGVLQDRWATLGRSVRYKGVTPVALST
jgi:hypothetical protein